MVLTLNTMCTIYSQVSPLVSICFQYYHFICQCSTMFVINMSNLVVVIARRSDITIYRKWWHLTQIQLNQLWYELNQAVNHSLSSRWEQMRCNEWLLMDMHSCSCNGDDYYTEQLAEHLLSSVSTHIPICHVWALMSRWEVHYTQPQVNQNI